ncbi:Rz1-like lysis system protein LysC [Canicola haemoglobinophilus]|uniref:Rz1-like lysis system protein LysC n=1 Tax=Canicola haemoglobinophilus TaxID=733 RepID=UPI001F42AA3D|nr:Rz1-like lysis system protein LysC [Canicola haemoglobinophilus]
MRLIKPTPLLCPMDQLCQMPQIKLKNNSDLVLALDKSLNAIEQCRLKEQALTQCIENYNRTLQEKNND